ncbi:MAG: LysM peptidoglycan-binding domain-containing protein [Prevotellaceae bacterium]|nr:LysM peptidoglycan-binding domain-containing protein [Prevotellaceae bacterium]
MKYRIFIIFLLFLPFNTVLAQTVQPVPVNISTELVKIQGKVFYIHQVLKSQTLYSISRVYGVTQDEIHKYNPQLAGTGLQEGMFLQIPQIKGKSLPVTTPTTEITPVRDTVLLYKPLDTIKEESPTKEKQEPQLSCRHVESLPDINECEVFAYNPDKTRFHIALLLPLSAQHIIQPSAADSVEVASRLRNSENFVEFYGGALMAVQDLKEKGFAVEVSVFDEAETNVWQSLISGSKLKNMDLIIGPVYVSSLTDLLSYANNQHIPVVSPLDTKAEILVPDYPNLFQIPPPVACQQLKLLSGISPENDNVILVYEEEGEDQALFDAYKSILSKCHFLSFLPYKVSKGIAIRDSIRKRLVLNKENCVVVASNNEALVTDLTSNLSPLQSRLKYPITLYGQARWRGFDNVDFSFLHAMNLRLVTPFFVDYKDADVKNFVSRYRKDFNADPSQYAFQGYDVTKFFLTALHRYGPHFGDCISLLQAKLLQGSYQFRRLTPQGGYINTGASLIRYTPEFDIKRE